MLGKPKTFNPWPGFGLKPMKRGVPAGNPVAVVRGDVSRDPTPTMIEAGQIAADDHVTAARVAAIWRAMFDESRSA